MENILKGLFYGFEDNIKDSKYYFDYYKMAMECNNTEMARYFLNEAKSRLDKNEEIKNKIEYIIRNHMPDAMDSPYKLFYDSKIEECQKLKHEYTSATI